MAENWVVIYKQSSFKYRTFLDKDSIDTSQYPIVSYLAKYEQQPLMFGDMLYFATQGRLQKFFLLKMQVNCQLNTARTVATKVGNSSQDFVKEDKPFGVIQKGTPIFNEAAVVCAGHEVKQ
jgi:hypothetical protein